MKSITSKIEFWIVLFFIVRLIGITNPPLEVSHNWRQVTGLMVSKNFLDVDNSILYPRIHDNLGSTGIIGMEFPILNYVHYGISKLFGYTHWYGRIINLIISTLGLFYFSKIISRYFSRKIAFAATLSLAASIWFIFSRKTMPDTACISVMFIAIYNFMRYIDTQRLLYLLWFALFSTLALLIKIPAGIYLVIAVLILMYSHYNFKKIAAISMVFLVPLVATYVWYFMWNPYLSETYGNWYNSGKTIHQGYIEIVSHSQKAFQNFYFHAFTGYTFFVVCIAGIIIMIVKKQKILLFVFSSVFIVFVLYALKSGYFFYHHNYYIIPFVPIMALAAGYAIAQIKQKWLFIVIISLGVTESIANQQQDFFIKKSELYKLELLTIADSISLPQDLVAISGEGNPQELYFSNRKGWICSASQMKDTVYLQSIIEKKCKFIIVNKQSYNIDFKYVKVFDNKNYTVYTLK